MSLRVGPASACAPVTASSDRTTVCGRPGTNEHDRALVHPSFERTRRTTPAQISDGLRMSLSENRRGLGAGPGGIGATSGASWTGSLWSAFGVGTIRVGIGWVVVGGVMSVQWSPLSVERKKPEGVYPKIVRSLA